MWNTLVRLALAAALFSVLTYTTRFDHVQALVPGPCSPVVSPSGEAVGKDCLYRDVTVAGRLISQSFDVIGPAGGTITVPERPGMILTGDSGFTPLTFVLLAAVILLLLSEPLVWVVRVITRYGSNHRNTQP